MRIKTQIAIAASCLLVFLFVCFFFLGNLKVTEMKAEYFPPKEDVILQNEAPTDLYILVTGAMVNSAFLLF